jgi:hypothetical protein
MTIMNNRLVLLRLHEHPPDHPAPAATDTAFRAACLGTAATGRYTDSYKRGFRKRLA